MLVTKVAGVIVVQRGDYRPRARPLAGGPPPSRMALAVPVASSPDGQSGAGEGEDGGPPRPAAAAEPALVGRRLPADAREAHEPPPGVGRAL